MIKMRENKNPKTTGKKLTANKMECNPEQNATHHRIPKQSELLLLQQF